MSAPSIDLANLPEIMTPPQLGTAMDKSVEQLALERSLGTGPPFVKYGRRVYYLRSVGIAFWEANRKDRTEGR